MSGRKGMFGAGGPRKWTAEELLTCAEMMKEGCHAAEIAVKLGKTKHAVIGMAHRHPDLRMIGFAWKTSRPGLAQREREREERMARSRATMQALRLQLRTSVPSIRSPSIGQVLGRPMELLDSWSCRFPLWGDDRPPVEKKFFCAETKAQNSSYCARHRELCRVMPKKWPA